MTSPGRRHCFRTTSYCTRCHAPVGGLCRKFSPHPVPKTIALPPSKSSNARRFRSVIPKDRQSSLLAQIARDDRDFRKMVEDSKKDGSHVYSDEGSLFTKET